MTTKVHVQCQENSHWPIVVIVEDLAWDPVAKKMTDEWKEASRTILVQDQHLPDTYVHSSRRLVIEEVPV